MSEGLSFKIGVDAKGAASALQEIRTGVQSTKETFKGLNETLQGVNQSMRGAASFAASLNPVFVAIAATVGLAGAAVKALASSINEAIGSMDKIGKVAQEAGASVEDFSALSFAAGFSDVSPDDLATSFKTLAGKMQEALGGGKEAVAVFQKLGVAFQNVDGSLRAPQATFRDIVASFSRLNSGAEKVALAVDLFGRSGQKLLPIINDGVAGLDEWTAKAREAGAVISDDLAKQADNFGDSMQLLKEQFKGIFITIASELLPTLNMLAKSFQGFLTQGGLLKQVMADAAEATRFLIDVADTATRAVLSYGALMKVHFGQITEQLRFVITAVTETTRFLWDVAKAQTQLYRDLFSEPGKALSDFGKTIQGLTSNAIDASIAAVKGRKNSFVGAWSEAFDAVRSIWKFDINSIMPSSGLLPKQKADSPVLNTPGKLDKETVAALDRINDEYAKATKSRLDLIDYERQERLRKLREQIDDEEDFQGAKLAVEAIFAKKRRDVIEDQRRAQAEVQLSEIKGRSSGISSDPDLTRAQKKARLLPLLQQETDLVNQQVAIYRDRAQDATLTDEQQIDARRRMNDLDGDRVRLLQQIRDLQADTFGGTFSRGMVQMFDEFGNVGMNLANGALKTLRSAIDGVTDGIMGAIDGTVTWGQVGARIFKQMLTDLIKIGIQAIFVKAITSFMPGLGGILGIGARAKGGVATHGLYQLGEEGPEHVINAPTLARYGPRFFDDMNAGKVPTLPARESAPATVTNRTQRVAVGVFDRRSHFDEWVQANNFDDAVMAVVRRNG